MKIFITGGTGLLGRRLIVDRLSRGDRIVLLSRSGEKAARMFAADVNPNVEVVEGNPAHPGAWQQRVDGCDVVINLAGAGVADKRWNKQYKKTIAESRIDSTHQVVNAIGDAKHRPGVLLNASAVGFYGDCGDQFIDETHPGGSDFLADVSRRWEEQALLAEQDGARVVLLRTSIVLDPQGGAFAKMLTPFRLFVGGPVGIRPYWMPWIHWRDWLELAHLALTNDAVTGPLNMAAPNPVTNWQLAREIGATLGRPWWCAVPMPVLRIVLGEFARSIGSSQRVIPRKALDHGFSFVFGQLESAVESLLGQGANGETAVAVRASQADPASQANVGDDNESKSAAAPAERIRLLACDVEGALLRSDHSLDPQVVRACQAAQNAGCVVVLASGRPPQALRQILNEIGITAPVIAYHGALIWDPVNVRPLYHEPMQGEVVRNMIDLARTVEPGIRAGVEVLDKWYTDGIDDALLERSNVAVPPDDVGPLEPHLLEPVSRLSLFGTSEQLERAVPVLRQQYWMTRQVAMYRLQPTRMQILHPMADKSIALQRVAARLGAKRTQVMAIGDAINDAGMVEWAGFGVAVANACDRVRHLADAVVSSNDNAGVTEAIEQFILGDGG